MATATYIAAGIVVLIVALAGWKVWRDRKRGIKCAGCPMAQSCAQQPGACPGEEEKLPGIR